MALTKNGVPFKINLVSSNKYGLKCPFIMIPKKVTIHCTDNEASADGEIQFMIGNSTSTSYHTAIDEIGGVQGLPFNRNGWHAGDGKNGYGNRNTLSYEMCRSYDRKRNTTKLNSPLKDQWEKTFNNTIKIVAQDMVDIGLVANTSTIKRHKDWSGKYCPRKVLDDGTWNKLVNGIIAEYNRLIALKNKPEQPTKPVEQPTKPVKEEPKAPAGMYKLNKDVNGYVNAADAKSGKNKRTTVKANNYYIFRQFDGMLNLTSKQGVAGSWINPKDNVVPIVKEPVKTAPEGFKVKIKVNELWYYDKPNWNAKKSTVKKNEVFTVVDTITVLGSKMYKLKSGVYITANPSYVEKV